VGCSAGMWRAVPKEEPTQAGGVGTAAIESLGVYVAASWKLEE